MAFEKLANLRNRVRKGEWRYYAKRLFPGGNMFLYGGVQLVFRLVDIDKFEAYFDIIEKRFHHEFRRADAKDIERLCEEFPDRARMFRSRIERGNSCFIAVTKEEIMGFVWAIEPRGNCYNTNTMWVFRPTEMDGVWGTDAYVKPRYRLQGLFPYMMGVIRREYLRKGYIRLYGETNAGNKASLQTHLSAGYEIVWRVLYISILGLKMYVAKNQDTGQNRISFRYALRTEKYRV